MQLEELAMQLEEFTETSSIRKRFFARCSNLILLLRLYTFCVQKKLVTLCADEIDCLVLAALRLCLDKVVQLAVWDLEVLIGSLLDSYNQWDKEQVLSFKTFFQLNHGNSILFQWILYHSFYFLFQQRFQRYMLIKPFV